MLQALGNIFKIPDLRRKVLFTLGIFAVYRIGAYIPTPGIDAEALSKLFDTMAGRQGGTLFGIMNMFSGGALRKLTVFALGIMPYISASIILQLLTTVVPHLERLSKEGEAGRKKIIQYTRYGTIFLAIIQAFFISRWILAKELVLFGGWPFILLTVLTLTTGTAFIMWLGEQIQEFGIGNGISLIITVGIISRIPSALDQLILYIRKGMMQPFVLLLMAIIMVAVIVAVILITQGQRKIPVQYARRIIGRRVYGGQSTYIPLRVNHAGVIPIIFAQSLILFPATLAGFMPHSALQALSNLLAPGRLLYLILFSTLIIFFTYFYTAVTFNPIDVADNMRKYGGFVPGIRPGKPTAQYFDFILTRITLPGAFFLATIAVFPQLIGAWLGVPALVASFFGGTGLLIMVGVMLDTMRQMESHLLMRHYEGFMKKGRIKGRR
ncbi:MAG: preprotein translocase subunit SecY [Candidatus Omnitrophica bacterium]|nr:preprotein translocase subunit SecY [Candidatus Omnitrophota bacterium]